ncbi:SpoIID/LytB domain-containing protein [Deinococcus phoenicis]|uniref:SpoIID/LytB domain-containing protein n=1 Tax=Deinococcus phoenicis TaxID=1476583 RepID=A0A016QR08_9DEIO|nr:SpoIID/LytB domain-containing protein [Deinococcus phoenicis]EYB68436.1 SpoIID/LytB domain-containing protein [Deinococcus phoenicis]
MRSLLLTLALVTAALPAAQALNVRVLVASAPQLTVRLPVTPLPASSPLVAAPAAPSAPARETAWTVGARGTALTLNGQDAGSPTLYLPPTPGSLVTVAGQTYRGGVLLRAVSGGVQAINVVDVEDYLRGVVPAEMPTSWPAAALAAQAVIARTYVAARVNPALPYDTCATESCQVYRGLMAEKPSADAAVQATAGQVVAFGGKAASTYFSSDSGGFTASSAEVWGKALPYLPAKADPYSGGSPRARWRLEIGAAKVAQAAAAYRVRVGTLRDVRVTQASESGRALEVTLTGSGGVTRLTGADAGGFVRALGAASSRATLSGPVGPQTPLVVEGSGSGHGVGLSQYGALGLARQGQDHLHILGFYYPGTALSQLAAAPRTGQPVLAQVQPLPGLPPLLPTLALSGPHGE